MPIIHFACVHYLFLKIAVPELVRTEATRNDFL
jgi:hypothetical protein